MYKMEIQKTISTPHVIVDEENSYCLMSGESFPENVTQFYSGLIVWLNEYLKKDFSLLTFEFFLVYFNSSTSKLLMNILNDMDNSAKQGKKIVVNWYCAEGNDIMIECGEDFNEDFTNIEFNIIIEEM